MPQDTAPHPDLDAIRERVRASFARQSMMRTFGATIEDIGAGTVTLGAPILPGSRQQQDFAHAALTFGLGDSAAGYAALTLLPAQEEVVTVEMKINLLSPAVGDRLIAQGRVVRAGRRLIVVTAEVLARSAKGDKTVAILQGTMAPVPAG